MKPKEPIETRREMAIMHTDLQQALNEAQSSKNYVEVVWLCYAIFEQRIIRMIEKHVSQCPKLKRQNKIPVGISTRNTCIKRLIKEKYGGYSALDYQLFEEIGQWCDRRNILVHSLVNLNTYKHYDDEFKALARSGPTLVDRLYVEAGKLRSWSYSHDFECFPDIKCRCRRERCIHEGNAEDRGAALLP